MTGRSLIAISACAVLVSGCTAGSPDGSASRASLPSATPEVSSSSSEADPKERTTGVVEPGRKGLDLFVREHPEAFIGIRRGQGGVPVVVFGAGVRAGDWRPMLREAAGDIRFTEAFCQATHAELTAVMGHVQARDWSPRAGGFSFGLSIDPRSCSVLLEIEDLTEEERRTLREHHGKKLTVRENGGVVRW